MKAFQKVIHQLLKGDSVTGLSFLEAGEVGWSGRWESLDSGPLQ